MPQGLVHFPGIQQAIRASFACSHGITPSVCQIDIVPQRNFTAQTGNLAFTYDSEVITWKDCIVDNADLRRDTSGFITAVFVKDRRWKWAFGKIFGCYNTRRADESIDPNRLKSAQELATLCLEAMGERNYDVSGLDNQLRPEVDWAGTNPAQALQELCDILNATIVLEHVSDRVLICKNGQGADLPTGSIAADSYTFDPPEKPDSIEIYSAPMLIQSFFMLEAVGEDLDGKIKPIDKLSYKPASGWEGFSGDLEQFLDLPNEKAQELAIKTVFKWYRIKGFADGTWKFPNRVNNISGLEEILPIGDTLIDTYTDPVTKLKIPQDWYVWGRYLNHASDSGELENTPIEPAFSQYKGPVQLDRVRGIVMFQDRVVFYNEQGTRHYVPPSETESTDAFVSAAKLFLITTFNLRYQDNHALERYRLEKKLGGNLGTPPEVIVRDDLVYTIRMNWNVAGGSGAVSTSSANVAASSDGTKYEFAGITTNQAEYEKEARPILEAAAARYQVVTPQTRVLNGLVPIKLDGALQQVTYTVGVDSGCTTMVSRGTESNEIVPTRKERRILEKATQDAFNQAKPTENQQQKAANRRLT